MPPRTPVFGIVLAGGESRRMGRDKAGAALHGRPLLAWACAALAPQCAGLVVSRHGAAPGDGAADPPVVADAGSGRAGPLAGVLAGLDWVAERHPEAADAVSVAVDTPFLPRDLVRRLEAARGASGRRLACARSGGRRHPVAALWPVALRHDLRRVLDEGGSRRVGGVLDRFGVAEASWPEAPFDPFFNVNTAADLAAAERIAASAWASPAGS